MIDILMEQKVGDRGNFRARRGITQMIDTLLMDKQKKYIATLMTSPENLFIVIESLLFINLLFSRTYFLDIRNNYIKLYFLLHSVGELLMLYNFNIYL